MQTMCRLPLNPMLLLLCPSEITDDRGRRRIHGTQSGLVVRVCHSPPAVALSKLCGRDALEILYKILIPLSIDVRNMHKKRISREGKPGSRHELMNQKHRPPIRYCDVHFQISLMISSLR